MSYDWTYNSTGNWSPIIVKSKRTGREFFVYGRMTINTASGERVYYDLVEKDTGINFTIPEDELEAVDDGSGT